MNSIFLFVLSLCALSRVCAAEPTVAPAATTSPFAPIDFLIGGTWIATLPPQPDGSTLRLETRFTRAENRQGVRFDSSWLVGDKRAPYTSGMYAWNAARKELVIFYTDASGSLTEGTATVENGVLVHELNVIDAKGNAEPVRTRMTKVSDDVYTNEIFTRKEGTWARMIEVRYERQR